MRDAIELKRTLNVFDATSIGIGAIVGAGIFVVTGISAGLTGPAVILSVLISGAIASLTALSFKRKSSIRSVNRMVHVLSHILLIGFRYLRHNRKH